MVVLALGGSDCEALHDGWLGQPINSLSSLAYVAAGIYVQRHGGPRWPAAALAAVGVGSVLYHGPMSSGAEQVHDWSLAALVGALLVSWVRGELRRPPVLSLVAAGTALGFNLLSRTDAPLCRPDSLLQGHAAWHVLTALAAAFWLGAERQSDDALAAANSSAQDVDVDLAAD